jgi:hypothetical protein
MLSRTLSLFAFTLLVWSCGNGVTPIVDSGTPLPNSTCLDNDGDGVPGTGDCSGQPLIDCDDTDPTVFPGAHEVCNGRDDNCDGHIDEGLPQTSYYRDGDGDGFGTTKVGEGCDPPAGTATQGGDCDDTNANVHPGAHEVCNGLDDDCNGQVDEGLATQPFYVDADGDGFGDPTSTPITSCQSAIAGRAPNSSDCDDTNPTVKPGAIELCNKVDDNCDGLVDNGVTYVDYYPDVDGDGFGAASAAPLSSCAPVAGMVVDHTDCNDGSAAIKPGAPEVCNGLDDNCNGQIDDGLTFVTYYLDLDGDGFGSANDSGATSCTPIAGKVTNHGDCNDANPTIKPGAPELCNGVDDDCNGQIDDGLTFTNYYVDSDGDGFGAKGSAPTSSCAPLAGHVSTATDCDDARAGVHPGATEICNGLDDDCNGQVDDGLTFISYYPDADGDGHGRAGVAGQSACSPPVGKVTSNDDCNDSSATVYPGAPELCNGIDDNCDGLIDNGVATQNYYADADGDGYGASAGAPIASCSAVVGRVTDHTDCNDANAAVHPGAAEVCNAVDDNCNGQVDEGLTVLAYYPDVDGDGYGSASAAAQNACAAVAGKVTSHTDCNDSNATIHPGAAEVCNGVDDNCNATIDEGNPGGGLACSTGQFGICSAGTTACTTGAIACNRNKAPTTETCNGLDDNCNGTVDEGFTGLGAACSAGVGVCLRNGVNVCNAQGTGVTCGVVAGAPTAPACDGLDNDCDGIVDEPVLSSTNDLTTTAWTDIEVKPYYYSGNSCAGGVAGSGTDALVGGALVMAGGSSGISFQPLTASGAPTGGATQFTALTYSDVDAAQAADGYVVAGIWANNNAEMDLYYVDSLGTQRALRYTNFKYPVGCTTNCHTLDSVRVVRGNGKRVSIIWRESTYGLNLVQVEPCLVSGAWEFRAPGCSTTTLTIWQLKASTTQVPGIGADSAMNDWAPSQTCASTATQRQVGIAYLPTAATESFFTVNEDATGLTVDTSVYSVTSPSTISEPEVAYFKDVANADQFFVGYVWNDVSLGQADLDFWMTSDQTWHFAYLDYATQNGSSSISRPRVSANSSTGLIQLSAVRWVADATSFKTQVMTRTTDLAGTRTPTGSAVELSVTSGACVADPACRPGNKAAFTNWLPFNRLYYSASGSSPSGSYASVLTCN